MYEIHYLCLYRPVWRHDRNLDDPNEVRLAVQTWESQRRRVRVYLWDELKYETP
jgi:hypothetical protein